MTMVTRYRIERLTAANRTEFYGLFAGQDDWTRNDLDAVEFSSFDKAQRRADRVGGSVIEYSRPATAYEAMMLESTTHIHLQAAE